MAQVRGTEELEYLENLWESYDRRRRGRNSEREGREVVPTINEHHRYGRNQKIGKKKVDRDEKNRLLFTLTPHAPRHYNSHGFDRTFDIPKLSDNNFLPADCSHVFNAVQLLGFCDEV